MKINDISVAIDSSWEKLLSKDFNSEYFLKLTQFLSQEYKNKTIYPPISEIFSAFNLTPVQNVKVVIIGQDPYHGKNQAHGLAFSVQNDVKIPPSLKNIFKELNTDLQIPIPTNGNLTKWAKQGVLLINATLTVIENNAASHQKQGWENFTDSAIQKLSKNTTGIVFLLWGKPAQSKEKLIDITKHTVLKTVHPSPLSAYRGFLGCKHFSATNQILQENGRETINWNL